MVWLVARLFELRWIDVARRAARAVLGLIRFVYRHHAGATLVS